MLHHGTITINKSLIGRFPPSKLDPNITVSHSSCPPLSDTETNSVYIRAVGLVLPGFNDNFYCSFSDFVQVHSSLSRVQCGLTLNSVSRLKKEMESLVSAHTVDISQPSAVKAYLIMKVKCLMF